MNTRLVNFSFLLRAVVICGLLAGLTVFKTMPTMANSNPQFDITGVWKNSVGDTLQLFQEKDEVNGVLVNAGWAHRMEGRYVSLTKVTLTMIRRTRSSGCEMTMTVDITASNPNSLTLTSVAAETACGLTSGQSYPGTWTRVL